MSVSRAPLRPRGFVRIAVVLGWSVVVWVALWGTLSVANVVWGLVFGALALAVVPLGADPRQVPLRPWALVSFGAFFLWSLVKASAVVAWEVVTPGNSITEGIVEVRLRTTSPGLVTLVANAVSLTPGTLTLEARLDPSILYVHVLHLQGVEEARADIRHLEDRALAAFGRDDTGDVTPRGPR